VALTLAIALGILAFAIALDRILFSSAQDSARAQAAEIAALVRSGDSTAADAVREEPSQGSSLQLLDRQRHVVAASDQAAASEAITSLMPPAGVTRTEQATGIPGEEGEPYAVAALGLGEPSGGDYVLVVATPLNLATETVREATVPQSDDEIARLAETMNQMLDRLDRSDTVTRQFLSDASHELRSPLATIRAALEVPGRTSVAREEAARDALVLGEALRMERLVDDLLTLAMADDQGLALAAEDVDVDDLIDAEVLRLRVTTPIPVRASISAARLVGDPARLGQMFRNLVDNAVRHTTGGVTLSVATSGRDVVVHVDNDGPPIPAGLREAVFDRFARLEPSRERESGGGGLGLAIARSIAEAHHGQIRATETPAGRCRFEVRLPAGATA
jgi:signal transduction histidine kinase